MMVASFFLFLRLLALMRSIIVELLSYYHLCAKHHVYFSSLFLFPARLQRHTEWHHRRHMPCSGHRCPCRAMSLTASAASCVQLPRRLTHHHTVCRCRPMAHRMAVERGQDRGGTCHALGIAVLAGRCRLWPVPLLAFNCHAG